jgi:GDP/UDP-N,N'-diacetylbacillosamine 2-epimerase (hydrolysing)
MNKKKILIITGTRAEYGLLYPVLLEIMKSNSLELRLLVTGAHTLKRQGHTIDLIRKDGMPIAYVAEVGERMSMLEALAEEIRGIEAYCKQEKPDLMLVWGDRDEAFAVAIVAGHLRIPLAHAGGGDISGYVVDEAIRHAITKFAHVHFPISKLSAEVLKKLGEEEWRIHMVGTTAFDLINTEKLKSREELSRELSLEHEKKWILYLQHPTPLESASAEEQIKPTLDALAEASGEKILIYPNTDTGSEIFGTYIEQYAQRADFSAFASLDRLTYLSLLNEAEVLVGNSSSGIVEAGFLNKPVVNIGNRQKGRECGDNVLHTSYQKSEIIDAISKALTPEFKALVSQVQNPYGSGDASKKMVKVLEQLRIDEKLLYKKIA